MLKHPTLDQLHALGLYGMAKAFAELSQNDEAKGLDRHDWLALLLDREASLRRDKRLTARLRAAKLRQAVSVEDVDYRAARGLDRGLFQKLAEGQWIDAHDNLALVGPSGTGKSWLACAIGQKACRDNRSVVYHRWPRLCEELALARGDGRHPRLVKSLGRADLLILDDFGLEPLDAGARHDLLEIVEERYGRRSTIVTSQLPVSAWHEVIGDPTYAAQSSIASFTTPTASSCRGRACDERGVKAPNPLDQKPQPVRQISSADGTRRPGGIIPLQGGAIIPESPGGIIPLKTGAFIGIGIEPLRNLSVSRHAPKRYQQLTRERHDHRHSRSPARIGGARPKPADEIAVLLKDQKAPSELDHASPNARVAGPRQASLASP